MSGAEYDTARSAGTILKRAKSDLAAAKTAPHTGSDSTNRLKAAESAASSAESTFNDKYNEYVKSERRNDPTRSVKDKSHFTS